MENSVIFFKTVHRYKYYRLISIGSQPKNVVVVVVVFIVVGLAGVVCVVVVIIVGHKHLTLKFGQNWSIIYTPTQTQYQMDFQSEEKMHTNFCEASQGTALKRQMQKQRQIQIQMKMRLKLYP